MSNADFAASMGLESGGSRKGAGDYIKALKRRFWLVMLVGFLLGGSGVLFTLFVQKPVYLANAVVRIEAPRALLKMNHEHGGFDCPGCAWPDDPKGSLHLDICENGIKHVTWELTRKRVERDFFAAVTGTAPAGHSAPPPGVPA